MVEEIRGFSEWLAENRSSQTTRKTYVYHLGAFAGWLDGKTLTARTAGEWLDERQRAGLRPRTLRIGLTALRSYCAYLKAQGKRPPDLRSVRPPRLDTPTRRVPTEQEAARIFAAADRLPAHNLSNRFQRARARAILHLYAYAGLRTFELLALWVSDLRAQGENWEVLVRVGKGRETRRVPLNGVTRSVLEEYLQVRAEWLAKREPVAAQVEQGLWPVDRARVLEERGVHNLRRELLSAAGVTENIHWHGWRHRFGTLVERAGGLRAAQSLMGHANITTTQAYLHSGGEHERAVVEALPVPAVAPVVVEGEARARWLRERRRRRAA